MRMPMAVPLLLPSLLLRPLQHSRARKGAWTILPKEVVQERLARSRRRRADAPVHTLGVVRECAPDLLLDRLRLGA